jgi:hypothetical protein
MANADCCTSSLDEIVHLSTTTTVVLHLPRSRASLAP